MSSSEGGDDRQEPFYGSDIDLEDYRRGSEGILQDAKDEEELENVFANYLRTPPKTRAQALQNSDGTSPRRMFIRSPMNDDSDEDEASVHSASSAVSSHRRHRSLGNYHKRSFSASPSAMGARIVQSAGNSPIFESADEDENAISPATSIGEPAEQPDSAMLDRPKEKERVRGRSPLIMTTTAEDIVSSTSENSSDEVVRAPSLPEQSSPPAVDINHMQSKPSSFTSPEQTNASLPRNYVPDYQYANYQNYQQQLVVQEQAEDSDGDDDTLSVLEDAAGEDDSPLSDHYDWTRKTAKQLAIKWFWKIAKFAFFVAFFLVPGAVCHYYEEQATDFCYIHGTPVYRFSAFAAISVFGILLSDLAVMGILMLIKRTPFLGIQFLYYIKNLSKPLKWTIVSLIIFITWPAMFAGTPVDVKGSLAAGPGATVTLTVGDTVQAVFGCLLLTAFTFLAKAVLMRFLAIRFHRGAYYKRIKNSLLTEFVIAKLLWQRPKKKGVEAFVNTISHVSKYVKMAGIGGKHRRESTMDIESGPADGDSITNVDDMSDESLFEFGPISEIQLIENKPTSNHKLAVYVEFIKNSDYSFVKGIYKACIIRMNQVESILGRDEIIWTPEGESVLRITSPRAARHIATYLFRTIKQDQNSDVVLADFEKVMNPVLAAQGFCLFDGSWNGLLTEKNLYTTLLNVARERKALKTALHDAESSIDRLNSAVTAGFWLVLIVSYFMIFGTDPQKVLLTLSSFLLAIAFAIGNSVKALLESIIFIFVRHPFDIGDRVIIEKVVYTITRISLLTTEVRRYDNAVIYFNNAELSSKPMLNLRRSPDQFDLISMQVSFNTPNRVLRELESRLSDYLNKRTSHFHTKFEVEYKEIENTNRLSMRLWIQHRANFHNMKRYRERRGRLLLRLRKLCEQLGIDYDLPPQRVVHEGIPIFSEHGGNAGPTESMYDYNPTSQKPTDGQDEYQARRGTFSSMASYRPQQQPYRPPPPRHVNPAAYVYNAIPKVDTMGMHDVIDDGYGGFGMLQEKPEPPFDSADSGNNDASDSPNYRAGMFDKHSPYEVVGKIVEYDPVSDEREKLEADRQAAEKKQRQARYE